MTVRLNPYLNFRGRAEEALNFYKSVFGGELSLMRFADMGMAHDPSENNQIMHGQLDASGMTLMAADVPSSMPLADGSNISVSLSGDDEAAMTGYWQKLDQGADVLEPLVKAPWGDTFGMLRDRFGVTWLVNIAGRHPQS